MKSITAVGAQSTKRKTDGCSKLPTNTKERKKKKTDGIMYLSSASPKGEEGGPGLYVGELGTLWELCNKYEPLWWGKCGNIEI